MGLNYILSRTKYILHWLSQQPRPDHQTRIIRPCRPPENFLIGLETELNCKTLHLLPGSFCVSAISLWQDLTVIWAVSSILWTAEWLPPSPASFLATRKTHNNFLPRFLIPGQGRVRGEESQCTFISPEWAGPGWSTCVQCQCQYNFVMLWFVCQDKEEKEKLMVSKAAVEESDKEGCNSGGEEIIELQEMRMSPIPSLRNRHKQKYYKDPRGEVSQIFS